MTNEAISALLEHLSNEARNSVHASFGMMDLLRDAVADRTLRDAADLGRSSADRLLCSLDDFRDLLSATSESIGATEQFDLATCTGQIVEALNLTSGGHIVIEENNVPSAFTQDRRAVEQILTRVLDTASKLSRTVDITVGFCGTASEPRLLISSRNADVAIRLNQWLNTNLDRASLHEPDDIPFGIAVMVAAKKLRAMGGSAELSSDSVWGSTVSMAFPSRNQHPSSVREIENVSPDALHILVAEDCDDNFALTELVLEDERVYRAHDGYEAVTMLRKQRFDIVFMDVHMPGLDGYAAIRGIREWETETGNARTPIVVLSSDDLETQRASVAQCGCSGFFRKPLRQADLANLLDRIKQARLQAA
jgi:CheY-like chemotaxis protein